MVHVDVGAKTDKYEALAKRGGWAEAPPDDYTEARGSLPGLYSPLRYSIIVFFFYTDEK